jgi:predicted O-methyltransferase YrrM
MIIMQHSSIDYEKAIPITYNERAEFYEVEYSTTVDHEFLKQLIKPQTSSILEIPSGVGRNAIWLAQTNRFVVEADLEFNMIKHLRERLNRFKLASNAHLIVADMRFLCLNKLFDLIIVPQGGFQLIINDLDAQCALDSFRNHLSLSGTLLIDLAIFDPNACGDKSVRPSYYAPTIPDGQLVQEWEKDLPNGDKLMRSRIQYHDINVMRTSFFYQIINDQGEEKFMTYQMKSRIYSFDDFIKLVNKSGLQPQAVYRNYKLEPYDPKMALDSSRMIFLLDRIY